MNTPQKEVKIRIISPRPLLTNIIRSNLRLKFVNLYECSKYFKLPLYEASYWDRKPIVGIELIDRVLNKYPSTINIVADPRGLKLNNTFLRFLLHLSLKGYSINILEFVLGGFDDRIRYLKYTIPVSIGDYILSDGKVLIHTIVDFLDRHIYSINKKKIFIERSKHWANPRDYKGLKVPSWVYSGNHCLIRKKLKEIEDNDQEDNNSRIT